LATHREALVLDHDGAVGELIELVERGRSHVAVVALDGGHRVEIPADLLHVRPQGGYTIPGRWSHYPRYAGGRWTLPLVAERVTTGVRAVPRRVRIRRNVVASPQEVDVPVLAERVEIQRIPRDVFVETAPPVRQEGDTLVVPITEEVPVVQTRLRLREEVRVRVIRERRVERTTVTVRRHELAIERDQDSVTETTDTPEGDTDEDDHRGVSRP
jgi:hypothetical protein